MNHLENFDHLQNRYFALRHGKSKANEDGIIVSDPKIGKAKYGLVEAGRMQVRVSIAMAVEDHLIDGNVIILASDFARAMESAEITRQVARAGRPVHLTKKLRERFFGDLEGKSNKHYQTVWNADKFHPHHKFYNVESAEEVQTRTTSLVSDLENLYIGRTFILASHGDALQILETGFRKISPKHHREIDHIGTGELRELTLITNLDPQRDEKALKGSTVTLL